MVRAWAKAQGIPAKERGRVLEDLRTRHREVMSAARVVDSARNGSQGQPAQITV